MLLIISVVVLISSASSHSLLLPQLFLAALQPGFAIERFVLKSIELVKFMKVLLVLEAFKVQEVVKLRHFMD